MNRLEENDKHSNNLCRNYERQILVLS